METDYSLTYVLVSVLGILGAGVLLVFGLTWNNRRLAEKRKVQVLNKTPYSLMARALIEADNRDG